MGAYGANGESNPVCGSAAGGREFACDIGGGRRGDVCGEVSRGGAGAEGADCGAGGGGDCAGAGVAGSDKLRSVTAANTIPEGAALSTDDALREAATLLQEIAAAKSRRLLERAVKTEGGMTRKKKEIVLASPRRG